MTRRARGLAPYNPHGPARVLLEQVDDVLREYVAYLPLTIRQIFYRLVATFGYPKTEEAYDGLGEKLNRARRAGLVAFAAIRDDGTTELVPSSFSGLPGFWATVSDAAEGYRLDRQAGQVAVLELWVEAAGMAPQLAEAVDEYGVRVYSSGGFPSLTAKYEAATRIAKRGRPTVVLHVGDHDPSGVALFESAAGDVGELATGLGASHDPRFHRLAVTPEQIREHELETAPAKSSDRRGAWQGGGTVQAEAFAPDVLAQIVRAAVEQYLDLDVLASVLELEERERRQLVERVGEARP